MLLGQVLHQFWARTLPPDYPYDQRASDSYTSADFWRDLRTRLSRQWSLHLDQPNCDIDLSDGSFELQHDVVRYDRPRHCTSSQLAWLRGCKVRLTITQDGLLYEGLFRESEDNNAPIQFHLLQDLSDLAASSLQSLPYLLDMCAGAWPSLSLAGYMPGAPKLPLLLLVLGPHRAPIYLLALFHACLPLETQWKSNNWRSGIRVFVHVGGMVHPSSHMHLRGCDGNLDLQALLLPLVLRNDVGLHRLRNDKVSLCQLRGKSTQARDVMC